MRLVNNYKDNFANYKIKNKKQSIVIRPNKFQIIF